MGLLNVDREEIDLCVARIRSLGAGNYSDEAAHHCLGAIHPVVCKLRGGSTLFEQLHKLILTGDTRGAIRLLWAAPRRRRWVPF